IWTTWLSAGIAVSQRLFSSRRSFYTRRPGRDAIDSLPFRESYDHDIIFRALRLFFGIVPTNARNTLLATCALFSRIGSISAPLTPTIGSLHQSCDSIRNILFTGRSFSIITTRDEVQRASRYVVGCRKYREKEERKLETRM
ncbi:hypothetical protein GE061_015755, partial [Apolygus lucorum]